MPNFSKVEAAVLEVAVIDTTGFAKVDAGVLEVAVIDTTGFARVDTSLLEAAVIFTEGSATVESAMLEVAVIDTTGFARVDAAIAEAAVIDTISPQAVVSNVSGLAETTVTFDGSGSLANRYAWTWTVRPGGSTVGDAKPLPDGAVNNHLFNMTGNKLLLHFEAASGATPIPFPDNQAATPIDMTDNEGLYHFESETAGSSTPFPDNGVATPIDMTSNAALWHFEDNVTDASGTGNTLTLTSTTYETGKVGSKSLGFSGQSSTANIGTPVSCSGDWTVAFWFYNLKSNGTWRTGLRGTLLHHPIIVEAGGDTLGAYNNTSGGFRSAGFEMPSASYTGWHHIVAVGSGTTTAFYVDGVYRGSADFKSGDDIYAIGNHHGGPQQFADRIDEFAAWTRALSATEIGDIYAKQVNLPLASDSSGNGNDLIAYGTPSYVTGVVGSNAVDFNGTDQYLQGTITPAPTTAGSWACWFKFNSFDGNHNYIAGFGSPANVQGSYRAIMYYSGELYFWGYSADYHITWAPITSGRWYHLTLTWANTDDVKVYLDGIPVYSATIGALTTPVTEFCVGKRPDIAQYSDMECDELAIWSRVLSDAEVANIYSKQSAGTIKDSSGQDAHLTNYSSTTVTGKLGSNAADFNGTDQRVEGAIPNGPTTAGTVAGWLRLNTNPTDYDPMFGLASTTNGVARAFLVRSSRRLYFMGYNNDEADVSDALTVGQWYHVAMTWTSTTNMVVYVDGVPSKTWVESGLVAATNNFFIGKRPANAGYSDITVDEVAVWNRTLSATEILDAYNLQTRVFGVGSVGSDATFSFVPDIDGTYTIQLAAEGDSWPDDTTTADAVIGTSGPENIDSIFGISKDNIGTIMGISYGDIDKINDID